MAAVQRVPERGSTRNFLCSDLPKAEASAPLLDLKGHGGRDCYVSHVVVVPGSGNIASACDDGHVRVFDLCGDGNPLLDIPAHARWIHGLAALDEHVLASGSWEDGKVHSWDARTGERIHTIEVTSTTVVAEGRRGVTAIAAVGPETLAAGLVSGPLIFIQHSRGRQLAEVARHDAHSDWIEDIAGHADVMVTASGDKTACVWSVSKRKPLAVLHGHENRVTCAAVNGRYIATGSDDKTLRLYVNGAGFPLHSVLNGLHSCSITALQFIGSDLMLSGGYRTICFTSVSSDARPIARLATWVDLLDTAVTVDGNIAQVGGDGAAFFSALPPAITDAAKQQLPAFGSLAASPTQQMFVDLCDGKSVGEDDVRAVLTEETCPGHAGLTSFSEFLYSHNLVITALKCGLLTLTDDDWWFHNNLYVHAKNLPVHPAERPLLQHCLSEAKDVGFVDGKLAIDFGNVIATELREDKELLRAVMSQVDRLSAQLRGSTLFLSERIDRLVQKQDIVTQQLEIQSQEIASLRSAFASFRQTRAVGHALRFGMHLIPFVGGAIAEGVCAVASVAKLTKDLLGAGIGSVCEARAVGGERVFMRASMSLAQLKGQSELQRKLLDGLGISSFDRVEAMLKDGQSGVNELDEVEVIAEVETVIGELSTLASAAEKLVVCVEGVTELDNVEDEGFMGGPSAELPDFAAWKERGVSAEVVMEMDCDELGELIAAYLINFRVRHSDRFFDIGKSVTTVLERELISGELLVGEDRVIDRDVLVSLVLEQLESDNLHTAFMKKQLEKFVGKFMD